MRPSRQAVALAALLLLTAALACNAPGDDATASPTAEPWDGAEVSPTSTVLPPQPTNTAVPDVPGPEDCTLNAAFVADVTVPDDTQMAPGEAFVKTWRLRNTGTCAWEAGTRLAFISGDQMGGPDSRPAGVVAPDETIDIDVNLSAPQTPGTYRGDWRLEAPDGTRFGSSVYVRIVVPAPATSTPTPTPTATPTDTPTAVACADLDPAFESIVDQADLLGVDLGCPIEDAFSIYGAFQEFWTNVDNPNPHTHSHDFMIWRSDTRRIYALAQYNEATLLGFLAPYNDTWDESQPDVHPDCADMDVPDGYQLPVHGFGKVWCEHDLWDTVGWPNAGETAVSLLIQTTENGVLVEVTGVPSTFLFALDFTDGQWTTAFP
ncbi:MAG: hypothetical protein JXD18_09025 [Anaerolineae bacterium]|nr:hypothetical protein [Anaerolineae bacterium]